jgi:site-specific recombinase XerD
LNTRKGRLQMATVYKRRELRPIPQGAEIITYRGKQYAAWTDGKGKAQRARLNPAADRIIQVAECYTAQYFNEHGKRRKAATGCQDKAEAQRYANRLENEARKRRRGEIDTKAERHGKEARRPLSEHVADFKQYLRDKGNTEQHVNQTTRQVQVIIDAVHAEHIANLDGAAVMRAIGAMRERKDDPASLRTCNAHLRSVKSFTRWLWKEKRTPDDALAGLSQFNEATDRRHVRRELTPEELAFLLPHVERDPKGNFCLSGPVRAMAYRVALGTGFRVKELRTLSPGSFDLDSDPPTVMVPAAYSKRRRQDLQPIRQDLAALLRPWLAEFAADTKLFRLPHNTSKMFQRDLAAARSAWIDDAKADDERQRREQSDFLSYANAAGEVADFHAQRHTYISGIVAGGASVKTCQELARHSTPVLTIGRYSHTRLHDLQGALDALPDVTATGTDTKPEVIAATGTDAQALTVDSLRGQMRGQYSRRTLQESANPDERHEECKDDSDSPQVPSMSGLRGEKPGAGAVVRGGVEPPTHGFSVRCSTN